MILWHLIWLKSWVVEDGWRFLDGRFFDWGWKFPLDASVVMVDIFLISGLVDEDFRLFTMLRLLRAAKFRKAPWWKGKILRFFTSLSQTKWCHNFFCTFVTKVMSMFENRLATQGNMVLVYWSIIFQAILSILVVNHSLVPSSAG